MAAPDLAILLVHTGQSSSLIGQNAEADTVPARLPEMKYREAYDGPLIHTVKAYCSMKLTFMKYVRTNSQSTVVMPSSARPLPTLRTVFFRLNFWARPSTEMMNLMPYDWK